MAEPMKLGPLSPEILKLTEKLAKDPKSKFFAPLAEEYIKSGMLDEAVIVLQDGLKVHPHFSTARVTLGKAYLEKGRVQDAKAEFEQAIATSPDNLLAHRKLARIYKDEGRWEQALSSCQAILSVSPKDVEMSGLRDEIVRLSGQGEIPKKDGSLPDGKPRVEVPRKVAPPGPEEIEETVLTTRVVEISTGVSSDSVEPAKTKGPGSRSFPVGTETPVSSPSDAVRFREGMTEEIATESLADLYVKQGYYDKGVEIYRRLLEKDPGNMALERKCDETEVLMGILDKPHSAVPFSDSREATPPTGKPAETSVGTSAPRDAPKDRPPDEKIKMLEAWLESIRKGQEL